MYTYMLKISPAYNEVLLQKRCSFLFFFFFFFLTVKGLLLFVCTHNINKTLCFYKIKKTNMMHFLPFRLEQKHFTKMNRNSVNTGLTDMTNISIESFKLLLNEINQIENKNSFIIIIICKDAFLSKETCMTCKYSKSYCNN